MMEWLWQIAEVCHTAFSRCMWSAQDMLRVIICKWWITERFDQQLMAFCLNDHLADWQFCVHWFICWHKLSLLLHSCHCNKYTAHFHQLLYILVITQVSALGYFVLNQDEIQYWNSCFLLRIMLEEILDKCVCKFCVSRSKLRLERSPPKNWFCQLFQETSISKDLFFKPQKSWCVICKYQWCTILCDLKNKFTEVTHTLWRPYRLKSRSYKSQTVNFIVCHRIYVNVTAVVVGGKESSFTDFIFGPWM